MWGGNYVAFVVCGEICVCDIGEEADGDGKEILEVH